MDGVQEFTLEDVYIHDIVNWGDLGSDECGEYEYINFASGFDTDKDIQYGYTANNVHGILTDYASGTMKNIKIENLKSWYGTTHGIALYKGSDVQLHGDFSVNNLVAGYKMSKKESDIITLPNSSPYVCSVYIGPNSDADTDPDITPLVAIGDTFDIIADTIYGYDSCESHERVGLMSDVVLPEVLRTEEEGRNKIMNDDIIFSLKPKYNYNSMIVMIGGSIFIFIACMIIACKNKQNELKGLASFSNGNNYGSF